MIRAKFTVKSKRQYLGYSGGKYNIPLEEVSLSPLSGEKKENASWSAATPSGELKMSIDNPAAVGYFELGKDYYIDFTLVED